MKKKSLFGIMVTMTLVITLFSGLPVKSQPYWAGTIKIGAIGPMPWIQGQGIKEGTELAADQINAGPDGNPALTTDNGIIMGANQYKVQIVTADTLRGMPDPTGTTGAAAASELVAAGCDFVIGGFRTEAVMGAREVFMDYKKIYIVAGAATNEIIDDGTGADPKTVRSNYDRYRYIFRATPVNGSELVSCIAGYAKYLMAAKLMPMYTGYAKPLKIAVITETLTWANVIDFYLAGGYYPPVGMEIWRYFWNYVVGMSAYGGVEVVYTARIKPSAGIGPITTELNGVTASGARLLVSILSGSAGRTLADQWGTLGVNAFLAGIDVLGQEIPGHWTTFLTATGATTEYEALLATAGSNTPMNPRTTAFYDAYMAKYGHSPIYTSYGAYDAVIGIEQMLELGPDGAEEVGGGGDDPDWWVPGADVTGLIPYMEAGIRDGSKTVYDYIGPNTQGPNIGITAKFKYTGPHPMDSSEYDTYISHGTTTYLDVNPQMKGTLHDLYSGPTVNVIAQDDAHGAFWLEGWSRSAVGQWQEVAGAGSLEIVYPLSTVYATKTKIPERMYPLAEVDLATDGIIDIADMDSIQAVWQSSPPASWANPLAALANPWVAGGLFAGLNADMDYDKIITITDAGAVAKAWGKSVADYGLTWPLP